LGDKIEKHYDFPQDAEWAIEDGRIYMVQTRPVTTLKKLKIEGEKPSFAKATEGKVILKGLGASLGMSSGKVVIIHSASEIDKIKKGDVLVTEMTNPDFVPVMKKAIAIVTDTGGRTSHAAIVSRELGIPCVVGTGGATTTLGNDQIITVDGMHGIVYEGKVEVPEEEREEMAASICEEAPVTGTKIYVNLAEVELAEKIAKKPVDGVGLLRAEFMIADIGEHPKAMLEAGKGQEFTDKLAKGLKTFAQAFAPCPVIYRATDFKTNEYRNLKGGEKYEPKEDNPMIGYRGCFRYIKDPDVFNLELEAIKKVRNEFGLDNLHLMLPFVRTIDEVVKIKKLLEKAGLQQDNSFKLWLMAEVPSIVFLMEDFCQLGIDGVSIGSNDLTQLILGLDRDSSLMAEEFDERNKAVLKAIEEIITTCKKYNVTVSICGQAPSVYPEITEFLVEKGVTSISVNPDVITSTRKLVASVEQKLLLSKLRELEEKEIEEEKESRIHLE
jgi:pyruvate,water dikinase